MAFLPILIALLFQGAAPAISEQQVHALFQTRTGSIQLPPGTIEISASLQLPDGAHDLEVAGNGTTLRAANRFHGRAIILCRACRNIHLRGLSIDGNRQNLERPRELPPSNRTFAETFENNGLLFESGERITLAELHFTDIASFAVLVSATRSVTIRNVTVEASGGHNQLGRNNTSGGILLEEGVAGLQVTDCHFRHIAGNALWTHSRYGSPRSAHGLIARNRFEDIGRDAIQVGHASDVHVRDNSGERIGWPVAEIDVEARATPVAIDTAGDVDASSYEQNRFAEIDGKCIDLDGFHDGVVRGNVCVNRGGAADYPWGQFGIVMNNSAVGLKSRNVVIEANRIDGAKYGGIFIIGEGNRVLGNSLLRMNLAHCSDAQPVCRIAGMPELLSSGIYLGAAGAQPAPARGNLVQGNTISGWGMKTHCVEFAPGVTAEKNTIKENHCADE